MMLTRMMPAAIDRTLHWADDPCPLCGCEGAEVVCEAQDPASENGRVFSVVRCRECGLQYTNPRPDPASIGQYYPADYKPHHRRNGRNRPLAKSRFSWLTGHDCAERRGLLPVPRPGRLLDFGCGSGTYLARMAERGWQVTGLDASDDTVRRIREDLHVPAHAGTLPHPDLAPCSFDAITMWHSLEHVHDPLSTLRSALKLLAPGGLLLVACPNIESTPSRWFGPDWFGLDLPRHLTHFSEVTLKEMLTLAGFRTRNIRGIKHSDWLRGSAEIAAKRGSITTSQQLMRWKPAAKLAAWLTWAFGISDCLLAIAERPHNESSTNRL